MNFSTNSLNHGKMYFLTSSIGVSVGNKELAVFLCPFLCMFERRSVYKTEEFRRIGKIQVLYPSHYFSSSRGSSLGFVTVN